MGFKIPDALLASAFLDEGGEPAWPRQDALKVISWATDLQIAVLGGEIWLATTPGPTIPTPYIYTFEVRRLESEDWHQFVKRANRDCADYVRNFDWDPADYNHHGRIPYFNLTFSEV